MTVVRLEHEMPSEELVEWAIYDQLEAEDRAPGSAPSPARRTKPVDDEDDD